MTIHPDDERLSAAFDGHDHLGDHAQCAECLARLDQLAGVAHHIQAPVADVPDTTAAVAAAMAGARGGAVIGTPATNALPLPRRSRPPAFLAAVAIAAVVAGLIAVPLTRSPSDKATTTAGDLAAPSDIPQLEGDDLGELDDARVLAEAIAPVIGRPGPNELAARSSASGGSAAAPFAAQDSGADAGAEESSAAAGAKPASSTTARATTARPGTRRAPCAAGARKVGRDRIERLLYSAPLRWQGQSAVVLVFDASARAGQNSASPRNSWMFIMSAPPDCLFVTMASF